jgi:predicted metal-dependent phosphoesterase TrpH
MFARPEKSRRTMLKVDLHCHSNVSDGVLAPAAVAAYARKGGVEAWALTDHDEVGGIKLARAAASEQGMRFVPGVEISVTWANQTVHVVGLQIDEDNPELLAGLAKTRQRTRRARTRNRRPAGSGRHPGRIRRRAEIRRQPGPALAHPFRALPGRVRQVRDDVGSVPQFPHRRQTRLCAAPLVFLAEAIGWIRSAGGIPVIAHPGRYKFTQTAEDALFDEFRQLGGNAIEVVTGSHTPDQYAIYAEVARRYGFLASRGTDFHAPGEARVEFDALPPPVTRLARLVRHAERRMARLVLRGPWF